MHSLRSLRRIISIFSHINPTFRTVMTSSNECSAGIIVIGDEILKGQTADTNSHFICKHLFSWGVKVKRISVVGDDLQTIAKEISDFSQKFTHVITTGGIGPTHDDVTFEGVAQAFGDKLSPNPDIVKLCKEYFGAEDMSSPKMKLAMVPSTARLVYGVTKKTGEKNKFPLVVIRNVCVFPGVPSILERSFVTLEDLFKNPAGKCYMEEIYVEKDEVSIAAVLTEFDDKHRREVTLGSYPDFTNSFYKVKLTLESNKADFLSQAKRSLIDKLPEGSVVNFDKDPVANAADRVFSVLQSQTIDKPFRDKLQHSINIIEQSLEKYGLDETCIGFNGGKDCTAILHLFHAVIKRKYPDYADKLKALYIRSKLPFPEVEQFIQVSRDRYNLDMLNFNGRIRDCLGDLRAQQPNIKAVVMGTRNTDPYSSHLEGFSMTDTDWPQFMRVNPMLGWTYSDVWFFLRSLYIPYCSLYDRGYTSLGSMNNTHPNPVLQFIDDRGVVCYKPAYLLQEGCKERDGRNT
ncbi:FAD synthase-like [Mizuhopecten yessoensis]|uniref:FAD synthase n=1 Tax=Mizuhopecten yessoensis TaxID=6573 RepID=A0A210QUG9_MIZYE|nr:FAD synthase-like [Mizuhopecten yessoensis]OWF52384.1 FAD synthase [Mizuhopecten yessoensis]